MPKYSPASSGIRQDLVGSGLCTGTRFSYNYNNNTIIHFGNKPHVIPCAIPEGSGYLDNLVKDNAWQKVMQIAFEHPDARSSKCLAGIQRKTTVYLDAVSRWQKINAREGGLAQ